MENQIQVIKGQAGNLITGLIAPIKVDVLMEAVGIPESEWAIGEAPDSLIFPYYDKSQFWLANYYPDSICIVVADPLNENNPIGIIIKSSRYGVISPSDEIEIRPVGANV